MNRYQAELYHYGVKGMKWGVRKERRKGLSQGLKTAKIGLQFFALKATSRKTIRLPAKEYAHVMSEIATNITKEQRQHGTITKHIGNYIYTFENNFDGTYRVIGKRKI